ncbi:hypothetical protein LQZ18_17790 [Lachnospiraceae bacterium ZAX-1]
MVNVLVACGSGLVTSAIVENELYTIAENNGVKIKITKVGMTSIDSWIRQNELLVSTSKYQGDTYGIPSLAGNSLLSGIGKEEFETEFIATVKEIEAAN